MVSPLVKAECLVAPLRSQDAALEARYLGFFARTLTLDLGEEAYIAAARLRARFGLRLPDALHLACAQTHGCTALWTNDARLSVAGGALVEVLTPAK